MSAGDTIKNRKIHKLFNKEVHKLEKEVGHPIHFRFSNDIDDYGQGFHDIYRNGQTEIIIGMPASFQPKLKDTKRSDCISIDEFTLACGLLFHEFHHIRQEQLFYSDHTSYMKYLALEHYSNVNNADLYFQEYAHNIFKMDAEMHGIESTFRFLSNLYGEAQAEECIKKYIEFRIMHDGLIPPCFGVVYRNSVQDVIQQFQSRIREEIQDTHIFLYTDSTVSQMKPDKLDVFYKHVIQNPEHFQKYRIGELYDKWDLKTIMVSANVKYAGLKSDIYPGHVLNDDDILYRCDALEKLFDEERFADEKFFQSIEEEEIDCWNQREGHDSITKDTDLDLKRNHKDNRGKDDSCL